MFRFVALSVVLLTTSAAADDKSALPERLGVINGDFEVGASVANSGWRFSGSDSSGGAELSTEVARSGKRSMKIRREEAGYWYLENKGGLAVEPGQAWSASAWVKCRDTDTVELVISVKSKQGVPRWDIASDRLFGTKDWTRLQTTGRVPPDYDRLFVSFAGDNRALVWVDDVALESSDARSVTRGKRKVKGWASERVREALDRGMTAMPIEGGKVYLGWRLLKSDPAGIAFNVYRAADKDKPVRLNSAPLTTTTDFVDAASPPSDRSYFVRPLVAGKELGPSERAAVPAQAAPSRYLSIKLNGDHTFQKVGIADLDGDGRYDYVIKQPTDNIDPWYLYWQRSPDTYKIEAYRHDGTFLWRQDLGWSIERGIWYSPYVVYDLDGDGKAEVAVKTGEGDPRSPDGRVQTGPEYLSIWDGLTGKAKARVDWPSRDGFAGPAGYNYSSRNQLGIAFLDGKTPCLLVARGTYTTMKLTAYQYHGGELEELWRWDNRQAGREYRGQGAHFMHAADVDADGRDEVILGSCVIDDDGSGLWSTGLGHPDHCYAGEIDPLHPGLEIYYGIEPGHATNSVCLVEAATGRVLWGINDRTVHVHHSGMCSDIDPSYPGLECYSAEKEYPKEKPHRWFHSAQGKLLASEKTMELDPGPRTVYWDADPQRELLVNERIADFQAPTVPTSTASSRSSEKSRTTGCLGLVHADQIKGHQAAWADIFGDWREEIVISVPGELRVYTTPIPAADRRPCLMQDPIYRSDVAHLSMAYPQAPMTSYYIAGETPGLGATPRKDQR